MTIQPGVRLGPYEIVASIGAGGMGEVWRARDTRLDRDVAIKVLPPGLAKSEQFRERFEREAKAISQLNHPNVCTLHDVGHATLDGGAGEGGPSDGSVAQAPDPSSVVHYLVMEYIEGESLADRVRKGPLPLSDVLRFGQQIAAALHAAHRRGITHRDLKPGNVMLAKSGAKLLDFGLAKAASEGRAPIDGLSSLPTQAKPLTQEGTILGTFQYMAPEQLEGLEADARTDIFALGAVLYEMATGRRAFQGQSKTSLIAAIVSSQPKPISSVVAMTPPALDHVVRRCLEKDPDQRWQSALDVAGELQWISEGGSQAGVAAPVTRRRKMREALAWGTAALALIVGLVAGSRLRPDSGAYAEPSRYFDFVAADIDPQYRSTVDIARDGSFLVYQSLDPDAISVRSFDRPEAMKVPGTEGGQSPFLSPDGERIGFVKDRQMKTVPRSGGTASLICDLDPDSGRFEPPAVWADDGFIYFVRRLAGYATLSRVEARGGQPEAVVPPRNAAGIRRSDFGPLRVPGRSTILFSTAVRDEKEGMAAHIAAFDPGTRAVREIGVQGIPIAVLPGGYLAWADQRLRELSISKFDLDTLTLSGQPRVIKEFFGDFVFALSDSGTLVYEPFREPRSVVAWREPSGRESPLDQDFDRITSGALPAPDGTRLVATQFVRGKAQITVIDLRRGVVTPIATGGVGRGIFTPDGESVIYYSDLDDGKRHLTRARADGSEKPVPIAEVGSKWGWPTDVSPDGKWLAVTRWNPVTDSNWQIVLVPAGGGEPVTFADRASHESDARFSRDGRWVTFLSDHTGRSEVFVARFPEAGPAIRVSVDGGTSPAWEAGGKAILFYRNEGARQTVYRVGFDGQRAVVGQPEAVFTVSTETQVVPSHQAGRYLLIRNSTDGSRPLGVITNWPAVVAALFKER